MKDEKVANTNEANLFPREEKRPKVDEAKTLSVVRLTMPANGLTGAGGGGVAR